MDAGVASLLILSLIAVGTLLGFLQRRASGRVREVAARGTAGTVRSDTLLPDGSTGGERATLVLFSTAFCARCPATRRLLDSIAERRRDVAIVEIDLTDRQDLARTHDVRQTPTIFVLDGDGRSIARIGGPPRPAELEDVLARL